MRDASLGQQIVARARNWQNRRWFVLLVLVAVGGSAYALQSSATVPSQHGHAVAGAGDNEAPSLAPDASTNTETEPSMGSAAKIDTTLTVNGQDVAVPDNGTLHKVVHSKTGNTSINISNSSSESGGTTNMDLNIESHSISKGDNDST